VHRSRAYLVTLLSLALTLACAASASGVTSADLAKHQQAAQSARAKAAQQTALANKLASETARLDGIVSDLQTQANALNPSIASATDRSNRLQADITGLRDIIAEKQTQIDETQARYQVEQGYFAQRVEASYKQDSLFYLDMLFDAQNIGDLIARTEFVDRAIRSSNTIATNLIATKDELAQARAGLDRTLEAVSIKRQEAVAVETKLRNLQALRQAKTDRQNAVLRQKSALLSDTRNSIKKLTAIVAAEEAESNRISGLLRGNGSGAYHGTMAWPVPGYYTITSPFGWRIHPILRTRRFHAGIDISGAGIFGSAIIAAGSGKVIWAGPSGGYGNVVMVDHGNGVVSVYAHQMSGGIRVSVGQQVTKGQRIGTVGSTGLSTGPHLHFEVRVNGTPRNPMIYLR
jgi:murein DD-endopeptidase MepM/ murein hydrolase activator NlpD